MRIIPSSSYSFFVGSAYIGNGQFVASWYMGIRDGLPQPTTAMKVGVWSWRRESSVMDVARVRRYSWQF